MIRGYSGPRYMLELYLNESFNAKAMYTIRSLMLLTNISLKWRSKNVIKILDLGF